MVFVHNQFFDAISALNDASSLQPLPIVPNHRSNGFVLHHENILRRSPYHHETNLLSNRFSHGYRDESQNGVSSTVRTNVRAISFVRETQEPLSSPSIIVAASYFRRSIIQTLSSIVRSETKEAREPSLATTRNGISHAHWLSNVSITAHCHGLVAHNCRSNPVIR